MASRRQVPDFSKLSVAVVGDLISDHYLVCEPRGLSREAPVMVLRLAFDQFGAGGAANVARNLRTLGARTYAFGAVGRDARGRELIGQLEADGIEVGGLVNVPEWTTPTKTRVVAAEPRRNLQQVLRIDREPNGPVPREARQEVARHLRALAGQVDALVVSDYEYGLLDAEVSAAVMELDLAGVPVVLDPRSSYRGFEGVCALTPNVDELAGFTGRRPERLANPRELVRAAGELLEAARARHLLVTRGNLGMALFGPGLDPEGVAVEASGAGDVTDVSGAGDTAAAVFALALAAGMQGPDAMVLANAASGVVVMENGAAVCTPAQLREALLSAPAPVRLVEARL
jgi:D-beta-D-heptose 7-phosphate kinase/D-beta-D-heptose 1-phosphate adenosyltransferase